MSRTGSLLRRHITGLSEPGACPPEPADPVEVARREYDRIKAERDALDVAYAEAREPLTLRLLAAGRGVVAGARKVAAEKAAGGGT